jgi:hypothetical protein
MKSAVTNVETGAGTRGAAMSIEMKCAAMNVEMKGEEKIAGMKDVEARGATEPVS